MAGRFVPCVLERKVVPKVWGGRSLEKVLGIELPADVQVGETWEVYDGPSGSSALAGTGRSLRDLMAEDADALLGRARPSGDGYFPLVIKLIDAREALSVQVHPEGKNEAWVILHAGEGARIVRGLRPEVTREQLAAVAHTAAVEHLLLSFRPRVGDAVSVPAGTVHTIGPDVVLYEVQQNADVTYRFWDWDRGRETHVRQALEAVRYDLDSTPTLEPEPAGEDGEWLIRGDHFRTRRLRLDGPLCVGTEGSFKVVTVIDGQGALGWRSGGLDPPLALRRGDTALVPACVGEVYFSPVAPMTVLWSDAGS